MRAELRATRQGGKEGPRCGITKPAAAALEAMQLYRADSFCKEMG